MTADDVAYSSGEPPHTAEVAALPGATPQTFLYALAAACEWITNDLAMDVTGMSVRRGSDLRWHGTITYEPGPEE